MTFIEHPFTPVRTVGYSIIQTILSGRRVLPVLFVLCRTLCPSADHMNRPGQDRAGSVSSNLKNSVTTHTRKLILATDVFGMPAEYLPLNESYARGVAMRAIMGLGIKPDFHSPIPPNVDSCESSVANLYKNARLCDKLASPPTPRGAFVQTAISHLERRSHAAGTFHP